MIESTQIKRLPPHLIPKSGKITLMKCPWCKALFESAGSKVCCARVVGDGNEAAEV